VCLLLTKLVVPEGRATGSNVPDLAAKMSLHEARRPASGLIT